MTEAYASYQTDASEQSVLNIVKPDCVGPQCLDPHHPDFDVVAYADYHLLDVATARKKLGYDVFEPDVTDPDEPDQGVLELRRSEHEEAIFEPNKMHILSLVRPTIPTGPASHRVTSDQIQY